MEVQENFRLYDPRCEDEYTEDEKDFADADSFFNLPDGGNDEDDN